MTNDMDYRRFRARQVGRLMQSYRLEHEGRGRGGRLSQSGLLGMMGKIKAEYQDYSHSTVARWESGDTLPTVERLEVFGAALGLSRPEIDGLIALAGLRLEPKSLKAGIAAPSAGNGADSTPFAMDAKSRKTTSPGGTGRSYPAAVIRYCLARFALPGLVIAGAGFGLHSLGLSSAWMFSLYVAAVVVMVLIQVFLKLRHSNDLRDFLFISVFFILSGPMVQAPLTGIDRYGLFLIDGLAGTPFLYLSALIANLLQALAAAIAFDLLWRWQYSSGQGSSRAYQRAAWAAVPPILLVYTSNLIFASVAVSFSLLVILPVLAGVMMALLILRDDEVTVGEWDRRFLLHAVLAIAIAMTILGGMGTMVFYWDPSLLSQPNHNTLIISAEIDFAVLGYPEEELLDRYRIASSWGSLISLVYMVIIVGGNLIVTIYRLGSGGQLCPGEAMEPAVAAAPAKRRQRRPRADVRYRPGWLAGHRILQPVRSSRGYVSH